MASPIFLCVCAFVCIAGMNSVVFAITVPPFFRTQVNIVGTKDMPASMQLDAVNAFKMAYNHLSSSSDRCSIVRQIFLEKYPQYKWHVAMYKAYSVQSIRSIDVKVNDHDSYVLFATKRDTSDTDN